MIKGVRENKKPTLKEWFEKHLISSQVTSTEIAIIKAIEHEQNKYELSNL